jgi:two-component system sensor histidine kinase DesK
VSESIGAASVEHDLDVEHELEATTTSPASAAAPGAGPSASTSSASSWDLGATGGAAPGPTDGVDPGVFEQVPWSGTRGWIRAVFPAIFLVYLIEPASVVSDYVAGWAVVVGYAIIVLYGACYMLALLSAWNTMRKRGFVIGAMVALCIAALPFVHQYVAGMLIYLVVLAVAELGRKSIPIIIGLTLLAGFGPALVPSWHTGVNTDAMISIPVVAIAMFGFFAVLKANRSLSAARAEVARLAAENERNRIARDLHDLLGHSLTTITVKAGLANRLLATDPERAAKEMGEVEELSRQSLADVRAAVGNYRGLSLVSELATGRELMRAAGIVFEHPPVEGVTEANRELFGWVAREGLTNVVRHARATRCEVKLGASWIEVVDDGHVAGLRPIALTTYGGSGLAGLRDRVDAVGGTVTSGPLLPRGWKLRVEVPEVDDACTDALSVGALGSGAWTSAPSPSPSPSPSSGPEAGRAHR